MSNMHLANVKPPMYWQGDQDNTKTGCNIQGFEACCFKCNSLGIVGVVNVCTHCPITYLIMSILKSAVVTRGIRVF